ncbi:MLO protein homolog 1-like [Tasmannia lanceolata]|uniref:MLO protein homolog 1-like n=1 Tax=Tasmannia lanceolata TaxID=3420 RepID=UPI004063CC41
MQYTFGVTSCFHKNLTEILVRVIMGVLLQFLCSYITFPLYALVTQMGSHMKKAIFEEQTANALKKWQKAARDRKRLRKAGVDLPSGIMSGETTPSQGSSPIYLLHKYRTDIESVTNSPPRSYQSDNDLSDMEGPALASTQDIHEIRRHEPSTRDGDASGDFSFVKP